MRSLADERGTVVVFTILILTALLATCALVLDVGSWFTKERALQGAADAATLAGAQDLPDTAAASSSAQSYASANVPGLGSWSPTFPDSSTIEVSLSETAPGTFSKLVGIDSVTVHAHARAVVGSPSQLKNVAPIAVRSSAACTTTSCFGTTTTLTFDDSNLASSKFGLISLSCQGDSAGSCGGGAGSDELASWIRSGYPGLLSVNKWFGGVTGEKIGPVRDALNDMANAGTTLLFPVFDTNSSSSFHVIGWSAFVIDSGGVSWSPHTKSLTGHFTTYVAENVESTPGVTGYGVKTIELTQ